MFFINSSKKRKGAMTTLENCCYDKTKLLHELSCISWFIEKHAQPEAKKTKDKEFEDLLKKLQKDLSPHIKNLHALISKDFEKTKEKKKK